MERLVIRSIGVASNVACKGENERVNVYSRGVLSCILFFPFFLENKSVEYLWNLVDFFGSWIFQSTLELYSPNKIQLEIQLISIHFSLTRIFPDLSRETKSKLDTSHLSPKLRYLTIFFKMSQELFLQSNHGKRILI